MKKPLVVKPAVFARLAVLPKGERDECWDALLQLAETFGQPHVHSGIGIRKLVVDRTATAGAARPLPPAETGQTRLDAPPDAASHFVIYVNDTPIRIDSSDYIDWSSAKKAIFPRLKPSTKTISLRLPEILLEDLKYLANKRDVPYQSLLKVFLAERVEDELRTK